MPTRFDLLILDLDGTLVDSEALLVGLVNETLQAQGYPQADRRAIAQTIGLPLEEVFQRALPEAGVGAIESLCREYRRCADAREFVQQFRLYADVATTLDEIRRAGTRLAVATSKGKATTLDILQHCRLAAMIDAVIGGDCVTRGKPNPEMVELACRLVAAAPQRTVMVGDTSFDIEMGHAAGVSTCAVTYGMHSAASLRALQPSYVIDRFAQLRSIVIAEADRTPF